MKKLLLFSFAILFACSNKMNIQQPKTITKTPQKIYKMDFDNYEDFWRQVIAFENKNLTKSAYELVNQIHNKAKNEKNYPQLIKSLLYQSKYMKKIEEDAQFKIIANFKKEINDSPQPVSNILENILAKMYWQYYKDNVWNFAQRTETETKVDSIDFKTWDLKTIFKEIDIHYTNSLKNKDLLQKTALSNYYDILRKGSEYSKKLQLSLYDLLAENAIKFYKSNENALDRPSYKFEINDKKFLVNVDDFIKQKILSKDKESFHIKALHLYQDLLTYHVQNPNQSEALAYWDMERLIFVNNNAVYDDKDEIWIQTLQNFVNKYSETKIAANAYYQMAKHYFNLGNTYTPDKNIEYKWKKKKALDICNQTLKNYPGTEGADACNDLKQKILVNSISFKLEKNIAENKPALLGITYKNLSKIKLSVYEIPYDTIEKIESTYDKNKKLTLIKKQKLVNKWKVNLKDIKDYQQHTMETILSPLPNAYYLILAQNIKNENDYAVDFFQVTNVALQKLEQKKQNIYIVDRNTGKPVKAKIEIKKRIYYQGYKWKHHKSLNTDKRGKFTFNNVKDNKLLYVVKYNNKKAYFEGSNYYYHRSGYREIDRSNMFLFTDRGIYRPGQTVYFKGIVLNQFNNISEPVVDEEIEVVFNDANDQEIKVVTLYTNKFGSFQGKFVIPAKTLTGDFTIEAYSIENDDYEGEASIKVEEYKRPKFEAKFKTVDKTYKVNDSIVVTGTAQSFAGTNITGAKVNYRVKRNVRMPRWWYWCSPVNNNSEAQEIDHGEVTTDEKGEFKIKFKALPDNKVKKDDFPVFTYEVFAEVTDINGETHTATDFVKVGYHSLQVDLFVNDKIDKSKKIDSIGIDITNLNGKDVSAKGNIKVYKLKQPTRVLGERPWKAPEYKIDKDVFVNNFPNIPYDKYENNKYYWKKSDLVLEKKFNTDKSKKMSLSEADKWKNGTYLIELTTKDKQGNVITEKKLIDIFSSTDNLVENNQLFTIKTNDDTFLPNDKVKVTLGSSAKNTYAKVWVEKNHKIIEEKIFKMDGTYKNIYVPVNKHDFGGFVIHYAYNAFNSYKYGKKFINVPYPSKDLSIETIHFRNKISPGATEKWSFKLKGPKKEKVAAEMLASMYDASLDEFTSNYWSFSPIVYKNYYSNFRVNNLNSYGIINFNIRNTLSREPYYTVYPNKLSYLNWFDFNFARGYYNYKYYRNYNNSDAEPKIERSYSSSIPKGTVKGYVYELGSGEPLAGANVFVKNKQGRTVTNFDGIFKINADKGDVLIFSFIGYKDVKVILDKNNKLSIGMNDDGGILETVVITANSISSNDAGVDWDEENVAKDSSIKTALSGKVAGIQVFSIGGEELEKNNEGYLRGALSKLGNEKPLYVVDGKVVGEFVPNGIDIADIKVLKGPEATALYGIKGSNGVIIITTEISSKNLKHKKLQVKARRNLQETAFFYPELRTDKNGDINFSFTVPESLTKWRLQLLAYDKKFNYGYKELVAQTQKDLMLFPNAPRFVREGDQIIFSTKISNLTDKNGSGIAELEIHDAFSAKDITQRIIGAQSQKEFTVSANGNTNVSWKLQIPDDVQAIEYKVMAKMGKQTDGEQNMWPVLSNRMLVTETMPLWVNSKQSKTFVMNKLQNNSSSTLKNHQLTLEITSNPAWYAIQALPYLMEYPYECSEQTFSRFYANALATHIVNKNPKIQKVFKLWKNNKNALLSNLEKNKELKSIIIEETPWLRNAQSESDQKKRIGLLFDLNMMSYELNNTIGKLKEMQSFKGGFPWFKGGKTLSTYITQHIIAGMGHLNKLGVDVDKYGAKNMISKAIKFIDNEKLDEYNNLLKNSKKMKDGEKYLKEYHPCRSTIHYLYARSFYKDIEYRKKNMDGAAKYYIKQAKKYKFSYNNYTQAMLALVLFRNGDEQTAKEIIRALYENSVYNEEMGRYWKIEYKGWYWYQAPIETQSLLIEAFSEITGDINKIDEMRRWLLKNKQTNAWKTTKQTSEAVYALLLQGTDWLSVDKSVSVKIGNIEINPDKMPEIKTEAGSGYFKKKWNADEIKPEMGKVSITKKDNGIAWGGLYWQYFEDLDKITYAKTPLQIKKDLFIRRFTDTGEKLEKVKPDSKIKVGDLVRIRIEIRVDRKMEFIHLKDMRASGFEPVNVLSHYKWQDGLGYYESTRDASTNFFISNLPKGVYVFEYDLRANNAGNFSNGITTIQSMYAPEYSSHSKGLRVHIEK